MNFNISTPTLLVDKQKTIRNITEMALKSEKLKICFRPHFKTHQSIEIGSWFKEFKIDGITVSSVKMAEYFSKNGWDSITVAFPVNILEINKINKLSSLIDLRVLVVDSTIVKKLNDKLTTELGVYIEIDPDYGRSGINFNDDKNISLMIETINSSNKLKLQGFYCHAGHSYKSRSQDEIKSLSVPIVEKLSSLKKRYGLPVCFGDTPSCSVLENFGDIDEISPGNFVFYDWIQTCIGSCSPNQIAVALACPVVSKYEKRNELLVHGGAVHFSKDYDLMEDGTPYFGQLVERKGSTWGKPISGCFLKSISQEHGIIKCTDDFFTETKVGDTVLILPIHSCLTADLMGNYISTEGKKIDHLSAKII